MNIFGKKKVFLKTKTLIIILSVFLFLGAQKIKAEDDGLIITEIMFDPIKGGKKGDWFEIYNNSDRDIYIEKKYLKLSDGEIRNKEDENDKDNDEYVCHGFKDSLDINSGEYVIIVSNKEQFEENFCGEKENCKYEGKIIEATFSLPNDEKKIKISFDKCKSWEAEISYENLENSEKGWSIEWDGKGKEWEKSWVYGGTPGEKKSEPKEYSSKIKINEVFPNPEKEEKEYVELYNFSEKDEDLSGWVLRDGSKTGKYIFPEKSIIKSENYFVVYKYGKEIDDNEENFFNFALNNSGEESVFLSDPNGKEVSKMEYSGSKRGISWNFDGKKWRQSGFLTPGEENKFNNIPEVKIEVEDVAYQDIYADFEVNAKDKDKDELKITWDFGDGHKSYLEKTRHKYEKTGKYFASLKVSDGSEDVVKNFSVVVKKYPRMEVKIVEIMPNPEGLDSEGEWILVKNASKKTVNLKGWSVATGISEKKLVNHPIYNPIKIKPGETKKITREDSYFSLGNKQAYIELRYPDEKVAYSLKYKEKESIKDNSIFQKEKGKRWEWIVEEVEDVGDDESVQNVESVRDVEDVQSVLSDENVADRGVKEQSNSVNVIPDLIRDLDELGENDEYAGKITQRPVEIEISPEIYKKLVEFENENKASEFFGKFSIRQEGEKYFFTPKTTSSEHYAKKFLEELTQKINVFLGKIFNAQ